MSNVSNPIDIGKLKSDIISQVTAHVNAKITETKAHVTTKSTSVKALVSSESEVSQVLTHGVDELVNAHTTSELAKIDSDIHIMKAGVFNEINHLGAVNYFSGTIPDGVLTTVLNRIGSGYLAFGLAQHRQAVEIIVDGELKLEKSQVNTSGNATFIGPDSHLRYVPYTKSIEVRVLPHGIIGIFQFSHVITG